MESLRYQIFSGHLTLDIMVGTQKQTLVATTHRFEVPEFSPGYGFISAVIGFEDFQVDGVTNSDGDQYVATLGALDHTSLGYMYAYKNDLSITYIFPNSMTFQYDGATQYFWCGEYPTAELYRICMGNISKIKEEFDQYQFYIVYQISFDGAVQFGYSFSLSMINMACVSHVDASIENGVLSMTLQYFRTDCFFNGNRRIFVNVYGQDASYTPIPVYMKLTKITPLQTFFQVPLTEEQISTLMGAVYKMLQFRYQNSTKIEELQIINLSSSAKKNDVDFQILVFSILMAAAVCVVSCQYLYNYLLIKLKACKLKQSLKKTQKKGDDE